jgi:hypothetical protein
MNIKGAGLWSKEWSREEELPDKVEKRPEKGIEKGAGLQDSFFERPAFAWFSVAGLLSCF